MCLYTNAHNLGNKQEELEATMPLENHNVVVTENLWDEALSSSSRKGQSVKSCSRKMAMSEVKAYR